MNDRPSAPAAFGGALEHAWSTFADLRYAAEIAEGQQEEEAQRKRKELVQWVRLLVCARLH